MKRFIGVVVALIGVVALVFGIIFIIQSNSGKQEVASELAPITLAQVDAKYDSVKAKQVQLMTAEEPKIQAGQAQPSAMYIYLTTQKTGLGLARANIGLTSFVMMSGIIDIILGIGLVLTGMLLMKKQSAS